MEKHLFDRKLQVYYLGVGNVRSGLDCDIPKGFISKHEHVRRLGELARIMTGSGQIFITIYDGADDYDIETLKRLSSPNDLMVVAVGESLLKDIKVDLHLHDLSIDASVEEIE